MGDLHKLMQEKMEKSDEEARKYGIVEKKPDGGIFKSFYFFSYLLSFLLSSPHKDIINTLLTERFPDVVEKLSGILSQWDKDKKKGKGDNDFQFWWKERPFENRVCELGERRNKIGRRMKGNIAKG